MSVQRMTNPRFDEFGSEKGENPMYRFTDKFWKADFGDYYVKPGQSCAAVSLGAELDAAICTTSNGSGRGWKKYLLRPYAGALCDLEANYEGGQFGPSCRSL